MCSRAHPMSLGHSINTSLIRAPAAQGVVSSRRSRSVAAASIVAPISSGHSPLCSCQRLLAGLTECGLAAEFDSTRADVNGETMLESGCWRLLMSGELSIPIGRGKLAGTAVQHCSVRRNSPSADAFELGIANVFSSLGYNALFGGTLLQTTGVDFFTLMSGGQRRMPSASQSATMSPTR
jgi:hypothetical protein